MTIKEVGEKFGLTQDTLRYYERIGVIPAVKRTAGGIRDYGEEDLGWVELAVCMRGAGLPVEVLTEYVRLCREGDETIPARAQLLRDQRDALLAQREKINATLRRLDYKISRYEIAEKTGVLSWDKEQCCDDAEQNKMED